MNKEIDTRIELYHSIVTKQELPKTAKLSDLKSVFVPTLAYGR